MKILELFAGVGGWSFGLKKADIDFETVGYFEIDKYAIQAYEQNHRFMLKERISNNTYLADFIKNYKDVTKIDPNTLPDFDLLCASPPCQSFSIAGKGLGSEDERGRLFENSIEIMKIKQPKYAIYENVKGLVSKKHKEYFDYIINLMKEAGYKVYWKVLNTKEYGIPQNRQRVFIVCFRNDVEENFKFPEKEELKIFLKDILEDEVDEKYYLSKQQTDRLIERTSVKIPELNEPKPFDVYNKKIKEDGISPTLTQPHHNSLRLIINVNPSGKGMNGNVYSGNISPTITTNKGEGYKIIQLNKPVHSNNRVYSDEGVSPALNTMQGGNRQPFIAASRGRNPKNPSDTVSGHPTEQRLEPKLDGTTNTLTSVQKDNYVCIKNATKKGYQEAKEGDGINLEQPNSKTRRGRVQEQSIGTLQTNDQRGVITEDLTIRKLTPTECFRLQGFLNDDIKLDGISNSQRYKLAGNGLSINVVSKIFKQMFKNDI